MFLLFARRSLVIRRLRGLCRFYFSSFGACELLAQEEGIILQWPRLMPDIAHAIFLRPGSQVPRCLHNVTPRPHTTTAAQIQANKGVGGKFVSKLVGRENSTFVQHGPFSGHNTYEKNMAAAAFHPSPSSVRLMETCKPIYVK